MSLVTHFSAPARPRNDVSQDITLWREAIDTVLTGAGLRLAAQPIVDVAHARVVGYEILARFSGPPDAPPNIWFQWADVFGRGAALDALIVERALALRSSLPPDTFITINIDPHHLKDDKLLATFSHASALDRVIIELTEHSAIDDYEEIASLLTPLRAAGAKVAIDDAGSGYAGLQWLMALSPDLVKIDQKLITHIDEDEIKTALVEMLGSFADRIDAWVLAEGVERRAELDVILRLGIPLAQGYLFGRPTVELWPSIEPDTHAHMQYRTSVEMTEPTLAPLVETVATRKENSPPSGDTCIVVDEWNQPVSLELPGTTAVKVLAVRTNETVASAVERAMLRDVASRWHPLICVTETRETLGIVRMERLIHMLVRQGDPDANDGGHE